MQAVFREARRVAPTDLGVLILGESGTGKEVLARYIHRLSQRGHGPFVAVNSAALPENLIESELFGHEKGAFTGAVARKAGRFEEASGGTLFLDEIGEMPLTLQPKLLRVLEARQLRLVGGSKDIPVDVRIVAATHRDLEAEVRQGRFREDLLYRLNILTLHIPPLRERREDILPLAEHFLKEQGLHGKRFSPAAQRILIEAAWPGNVRQLRNATVRAGLLSRGSLILPDELPETLRPAASDESGGASPEVPPGGMDEIQRQAILKALEQTGGNKTRAAQILGISRRNLIYKIRSYGL
jgi:DNA-binding NtrC family response regulator